MGNFFKTATFKILLGCALIISGVFLYTYSCPDNNIVANTLDYAATPVRKVIWEVSEAASEIYNYFEEKSRQEQEIKNLKKQISELRDLTVDYYEVKRENARLAKYYDFKKENDSLKFVAATVMGREGEEFFYNFIIDQGINSGVSANDVVVTENGLVGSVYQVSAHSAKVRTILSPESKIGVQDIISGDHGVISGTQELAKKNTSRMIFVGAQNSMNLEDIVVTSGLSGLYPKNLKIGKISSIGYDSKELSYFASVEPFEEIKEIKDVFVVTDFRGKGEIITEAEVKKP